MIRTNKLERITKLELTHSEIFLFGTWFCWYQLSCFSENVFEKSKYSKQTLSKIWKNILFHLRQVCVYAWNDMNSKKACGCVNAYLAIIFFLNNFFLNNIDWITVYIVIVQTELVYLYIKSKEKNFYRIQSTLSPFARSSLWEWRYFYRRASLCQNDRRLWDIFIFLLYLIT